jgi:hypothetical protein
MNLSISACNKGAWTVVGGFLVLLLCNGLVCGAPYACKAQRPADDETTYDFQRHYQAGDVDRYKTTILLTTNSPETGGKDRTIKYTFVVREAVQPIDADGTITMVVEFEQAVSSFDGTSVDMTAKMARSTQTLDRQGHVHVKTEGGNDQIARVMLQLMAKVGQMQSVPLPTRPVKVGEAWKLTPGDASDPNTAWSGAANLVAVEKNGDARMLQVNFGTDTSSEGATPARTHTGATIFIDVQTGKTMKLASLTDVQAGQVKTTLDIQYNHIDDTTYTVRRTYKMGEVDRYRLTLAMATIDPQSGKKNPIARYELLVRETVSEVAPDGAVTLVDEFERASLSADNSEGDITPMMPKVTQTRNANGSLQYKLEGGDARLANLIVQMIVQIARVQYDIMPPKPSRIGASWRFTSTDNGNSKTIRSVNLEAMESINGVKTLKLKRVSDTSGDDAAAGTHDEVTAFVDVKTGKMIKMTSASTSSTGENKTTMGITYSAADDKVDAGGEGGQ